MWSSLVGDLLVRLAIATIVARQYHQIARTGRSVVISHAIPYGTVRDRYAWRRRAYVALREAQWRPHAHLKNFDSSLSGAGGQLLSWQMIDCDRRAADSWLPGVFILSAMRYAVRRLFLFTVCTGRYRVDSMR